MLKQLKIELTHIKIPLLTSSKTCQQLKPITGTQMHNCMDGTSAKLIEGHVCLLSLERKLLKNCGMMDCKKGFCAKAT